MKVGNGSGFDDKNQFERGDGKCEDEIMRRWDNGIMRGWVTKKFYKANESIGKKAVNGKH